MHSWLMFLHLPLQIAQRRLDVAQVGQNALAALHVTEGLWLSFVHNYRVTTAASPRVVRLIEGYLMRLNVSLTCTAPPTRIVRLSLTRSRNVAAIFGVVFPVQISVRGDLVYLEWSSLATAI